MSTPTPEQELSLLETEVLPRRMREFRLPPKDRRFSDRWFHWVWNLFGRPTPMWMNGWRLALLRLFGAKITGRPFIHPSVRVRYPRHLTVGDRSVIQHRVVLEALGPIHLAEGVRISQYSHLCSGTHDYQDPSMPVVAHAIEVGRDTWIAADAYVGAGVTIGELSIVGARSAVLDDVPDRMVVVGQPARVLRPRDPKVDDARSSHV